MVIYGDHENNRRPAAVVSEPRHWDRPPRQGRSKYGFEKMQAYFRKVIYRHTDSCMTEGEVIMRLLNIVPEGYFRSSHLTRYSKELKQFIFEEKLKNA